MVFPYRASLRTDIFFRSYSYIESKDPGTLGECNSPLTVGQVLTYIDLTSGAHTATNTIEGPGASVYAVHVNGYVFAPSSTSSPTSSATSTSSTTSSTASPSPTPSNTASSGGLSTGAKAGIGIGVALGVLGIGALILAFFLVKRHRNKRLSKDPAPTELSGYSDSPGIGKPAYMNDVEPAPLHELGTQEPKRVYEMPEMNQR